LPGARITRAPRSLGSRGPGLHRAPTYELQPGRRRELSELHFMRAATPLSTSEVEGKNRPAISESHQHPAGTEEDIWLVSWQGGTPRKIDAGIRLPNLPRRGVLPTRRQSGLGCRPNAKTSPVQLVARGKNKPLGWCPMAPPALFSLRGDQQFIGIYDADGKSVKFVAPSVDSDSHAGLVAATANILACTTPCGSAGLSQWVFS